MATHKDEYDVRLNRQNAIRQLKEATRQAQLALHTLKHLPGEGFTATKVDGSIATLMLATERLVEIHDQYEGGSMSVEAQRETIDPADAGAPTSYEEVEEANDLERAPELFSDEWFGIVEGGK